MRVLGFRLNEVRSVIVKDNLFTWLMGTIIGVPVGMLFLQVYVGIADTNTNEFFVHISLVRILIAVAIILINVLITSLVVARQVKRIEMASALKSVD
jgi:putative ABC transport system permease protein